MNENSHLAIQTREDRVSSLSALIRWVDTEGESARGIRVIRAIAKNDVDALKTGQEPLPCDPTKICAFLKDDGSWRGGDPGAIVRQSKPEDALERRREKLESALRLWGIKWTPHLKRTEGGGRGNASQYRLEFTQLGEEDAEETASATNSVEDGLLYRMRPAKVVWALRWLFVPDGFELSWRNWRGCVLLTTVFLAFVLAGALGLLAWWGIRSSSVITGNSFAFVVLVLTVASMLWYVFKTFNEAGIKRIVECPTMVLAFDELYGQIRVARQPGRQSRLSVVRISAQCPRCLGDVELMQGEPEFRGRMVGRCRDAPTEHVFSFDPTNNRGCPLTP